MDEELLKRRDLTDDEWERLVPLLPSAAPQRGGRWADHRAVINGIVFRTGTGTGTVWRGLSPVHGSW
ncbi:transposase [Actinomadura rubrisoli]|uniref:transposase n=1 Tax=Actinomadura rubrisoli TaxID=2530368 RepID=UPI003C7D9155